MTIDSKAKFAEIAFAAVRKLLKEKGLTDAEICAFFVSEGADVCVLNGGSRLTFLESASIAYDAAKRLHNMKPRDS